MTIAFNNLILISDLHLLTKKPDARLDDTHQTCLEKLEFIFKFAKSNNAAIIQAGDFFDRPRDWYLLPEVINLINQYEIPIYCVYGQHDTYLYSEETKDATNLGILAKSGLVTILGAERFICDNGDNLYGVSYGQPIPSIANPKAVNILAIHAPIAEDTPYHSAEYMDAKKFLDENNGFDVIICGDIHIAFNLDNRLFNTGCMMRKSGTEYNFFYEPHFYFWNKEEGQINKIMIPCKPATEILTRENIEAKTRNKKMLEEFTTAIKSSTGKAKKGNFMENLQAFIKDNPEVNDGVKSILSKVMNKK